ncbi:outer membrane protein [Pseudorhodobacter sp.]|uniref:outer membrane protein n=1 Tax=Pseudorhodobacter sp. TaxID=1934400 RepID=UPI002AFFCC12|nr:porin [Pseudorhodobacter sp.]
MKLFTSLVLATSLAAPVAFAGGMAEPVSEPYVAPVAVVAPVTGDWTGLYAGVQLGYGDVSSNAIIPALDGNGMIGGVHAGYRHDFGQFVTGVELAYNAADIDIGPGSKLDSITQLKLMGGYDFGQTLLYATAGAAHGKVSGGPAAGSDNGWLIGIGMDYAINDAWTVGAELGHHRFDDFNGSGADIRTNLFQVKAAYRF